MAAPEPNGHCPVCGQAVWKKWFGAKPALFDPDRAPLHKASDQSTLLPWGRWRFRGGAGGPACRESHHLLDHLRGQLHLVYRTPLPQRQTEAVPVPVLLLAALSPGDNLLDILASKQAGGGRRTLRRAGTAGPADGPPQSNRSGVGRSTPDSQGPQGRLGIATKAREHPFLFASGSLGEQSAGEGR